MEEREARVAKRRDAYSGDIEKALREAERKGRGTMIPREMVTLMERRRLVAEVRTQTAIQALGVVDALVAGGLTTIEVSLAIPGAQEILTHLATRPDAVVGAGSVLDPRQATEAISCGARFIASPVFAPDLVPVCRDANVACMLGALTPTEIVMAQRAGAEMVKLFPAEALGGPVYLRALMRQLTHVSLQVSGNFTIENMMEYMMLPVRTLALGSLLVPRVLVERGNWQALTNRARAFVEFAANPSANAARFLAMMGIAPHPQPMPAQPAAPAVDPKAVIAAVPTISISPNTAARVAAAAAQQQSAPQPVPQSAPQPVYEAPDEDEEYEDDDDYEASSFSPAVSASFRPWDSRPVDTGDEEDWLR